jgi:hypothetical protein
MKSILEAVQNDNLIEIADALGDMDVHPGDYNGAWFTTVQQKLF